jgi:hypothetical protein
MKEFSEKTSQPNDNYIAISTLCKDDLGYISEWVDYHLSLGIDKIILYDNQPHRPILKEYFDEYIQQSKVIVHHWPSQKKGRQSKSQIHSMKRYRAFRWIGLIDTDEFVVLLDGNTDIKQTFKEYEAYDAVGLSWLIFGSNNHKHKQKSILYSYTQCCPNSKINCHIKSFINPKKFISSASVHGAITKSGTVNVNKEILISVYGQTINNPDKKRYIIDKKMRLNHYYTRSLEDWQDKIKRGGGEKADRVYGKNEYATAHTESVFNDDIIKLYSRIKERHES